MEIKHTVIKNEDIKKHLNQQEKEDLLRLFHKIQYGRVSEESWVQHVPGRKYRRNLR